MYHVSCEYDAYHTVPSIHLSLMKTLKVTRRCMIAVQYTPDVSSRLNLVALLRAARRVPACRTMTFVSQ